MPRKHKKPSGETVCQIKVTLADAEPAVWRRLTLAQIAKKKGAGAVYVYDFGDNREHLIEVERVFPGNKQPVPLCVDGVRKCPPEDCGSSSGYEDFLKAVADPKHPEHKEMLEWAGGSFDPEEFNVKQVNAELKALKKAGSLEALRPCTEEVI